MNLKKYFNWIPWGLVRDEMNGSYSISTPHIEVTKVDMICSCHDFQCLIVAFNLIFFQLRI